MSQTDGPAQPESADDAERRQIAEQQERLDAEADGEGLEAEAETSSADETGIGQG